jgi:hypothetical protein
MPTQPQHVRVRRVIEGVFLVASPPLMAAQCAATARRLGYTLACPALVPLGARPANSPSDNCPRFGNPWVSQGCDGEASHEFSNLAWPTSTRIGHFVLIASNGIESPETIIYSPLRSNAHIAHISLHGSSRVQGHRAQWATVPEGGESAFGGHLVLVWSIGHHTYALGFHGTDKTARELDLAIAQTLRFVSPSVR